MDSQGEDREHENPSPEAKRYKKSDMLQLPPELQNVDFSQRITWHKFFPYTDKKLSLIPLDVEPVFLDSSPALCHHVNALSGRARACTIHLKPTPGQSKARPLTTPMFMPVGTKGALKGITFTELTNDPALQCPIILANTYHLAIQPGTELVHEMGGLHAFQGLKNVLNNNGEGQKALPYNLLTDSGGFQMVSLVKLSEVTEEGVSFANPYSKDNDNPEMLMLKPEDSIRHQNNIYANIIMALDDVVSSVTVDDDRFIVATHRTLRWYDRCYKAHVNKHAQNLFPIVQGGLDTEIGGLREQCLAGFRYRELEQKYITPGYSIGGLAGGEEKESFWKVVDQCCKALPDDKPRYLMGVGYPLDLVVCSALGVDMYDCVYPTRTARFGVALVPGKAPGTLRIKANECSEDTSVIQSNCMCQACKNGISRKRLHVLLKVGNPVAVELISQHNIAYMMQLVRSMRQAVLDDRYADFARKFVKEQYPGKEMGGEEIPNWVVNALQAAGIDVAIGDGARNNQS